MPNYYSTVTFTAAEAKEKLLAVHPELKLSGTPDRWFGAAAENGSGRVETVSVGGTACAPPASPWRRTARA